MKTNILYKQKIFFPVGDGTIVCSLSAELCLDSYPEIRMLLGSDKMKKMIREKHLTLTADGNFAMTAVGVAKFNPSDEKMDKSIGKHIAEDRATEKIIKKACKIFDYIYRTLFWMEQEVSKRRTYLGESYKKMVLHNIKIKTEPK